MDVDEKYEQLKLFNDLERNERQREKYHYRDEGEICKFCWNFKPIDYGLGNCYKLLIKEVKEIGTCDLFERKPKKMIITFEE